MSGKLDHLANEEAERAVISACMLDRDAMPAVDLVPEDFTNARYRDMYAALVDMYNGDDIIDPVAMMDRGFDPVEVMALFDTYVSPALASHYAGMVKRQSTLRKYARLAEQILQQSYDRDKDPDAIHAWLTGQLATIQYSRGDDAVLEWLPSFDYYDDLLERRSEGPDAGTGDWSWPWASWNNRMDQLDAGMLTIIGARQGSGKTVYAEMMAEKWAKAGNRVAFFHFELNRDLMGDRRMVRHSHIPRATLKQGKRAMSAEQLRRYEAANEHMRAWRGNIVYVHCPGFTMAQVVRHAEKLDVDAIVIDYLNKAAASSRQVKMYGADINGRQADDVETVKNGMERNYWRGLLLAQFNKAGKASGDPTAEALRGTGEIADKANIIALLQRDKVESIVKDGNGVIVAEPGMYGPDATVTIDKNTMGVGGQISQYFHGPTYSVFDHSGEA